MIVGVKHCSVLDVKVDIVVNAANNHLVAGGVCNDTHIGHKKVKLIKSFNKKTR